MQAFRVSERLQRVLAGKIAEPTVRVTPSFDVYLQSELYPARAIQELQRICEHVTADTTNVFHLQRQRWPRCIVRVIGEYNGSHKDVLPVTVATYNIMTWREAKDAPFKHLELFDERDWGLIIYDEVHLLPAPVFQVTAGLQARRRLGLTATLVREDHREDDVFALIGPKKVDVPWKVLEKQGWIAAASCTEIRLPLLGRF